MRNAYNRWRDFVWMIVKVILFFILYIISIPFSFTLAIIILCIGFLSIFFLMPRAVYRTYKYRRILVYNQRPNEMKYITALISFYNDHPDQCSDLVNKSMRYIDHIFLGHPQQYVEYRYDFAVFLGKICVEANCDKLHNNNDVFDLLETLNFESCRDPRNYLRILHLDDIRIFKDNAL